MSPLTLHIPCTPRIARGKYGTNWTARRLQGAIAGQAEPECLVPLPAVLGYVVGSTTRSLVVYNCSLARQLDSNFRSDTWGPFRVRRATMGGDEPSDQDDSYLFVKESSSDVGTHHLRIVTRENPQWASFLGFRDRLRDDVVLRTG